MSSSKLSQRFKTDCNISTKPEFIPTSIESKPNLNSTFYTISVVAFYWLTSLSVVFLNKAIFNYQGKPFNFPIFVTWFQFIVAFVVLHFLGEISIGNEKTKIIPKFELDFKVAKKVIPLTLIYVLMLSFNNICLNYVEVTFYQVARSLTILFNIILSQFFLGQKTPFKALISCGVVVLGFLLGSLGEAKFSMIGTLFGIASSLFVALYGIYVKKVLALIENNEWVLLQYNTGLAILLMIPVLLCSGELQGIMLSFHIGDINFWILMSITALAGLSINYAMFLQIKVTTPLSSTISGTAKAAVQTVLAALYFKNPITFMNFIGTALVIFGSGMYSVARYLANKKN